MNDWGLYFLIFWGIIIGLSHCANYIIDPYVKMKENKEYKFSKPKIILTLMYCLFWIVFSFLVLTID